MIELTIDGATARVPDGSTLLDACTTLGIATPTLCYLETLSPVNVCRVCVVELEGSRTLAPSCSRLAEDGATVLTDSARVRHSRKLVLELLASSVDLTLAGDDITRWMSQYRVDPERFGPPSDPPSADGRDRRTPGHHATPSGETSENVAQAVKIHDELYVRDYARCILCYKCVEACGVDAQNSFAIAVAGRGFDARISTEFDRRLDDSACVYCGNCIGVCPTGALMFKREHDRRAEGTWDESLQTVKRTVCPYCGVGCNLDVRVQDNEIVGVTSPQDHDVTSGHLCIKGRFGWQFVQNRDE